VIASDCGYRGADAGELVSIDPRADVRMFAVRGRLNRRLYRSPELASWLQGSVRNFDVVDIQVIWSCIGVDAARACIAAGVPYVITPHGAMTRWDWSKQMTAKRIFFATQLGPVWRRANAVRYVSQGELNDSMVMPAGPYAIIPNAIELPVTTDPAADLSARKRLALSGSSQLILFLGRVARGKGVVELLHAFGQVAVACPRAVLAIAGPLEGEYGEKVLRVATSMPHSERVLILGPVFGDAKSDLFSAASLFVTLSKSEGLPMTALEALSFGVPTVLTHASNLPEVERGGGGVIVADGTANAANVLVALLNDPSRLEQMRSKARMIVEHTFSWRAVLPRLTHLYENVVTPPSGHGARRQVDSEASHPEHACALQD